MLLLHNTTYADHVLGGELLYKHLSGDNYKITLVVYGECSGGSFNHLKNAEPRIEILNEEGALNLLVLQEEVSNRKEVTNVCPRDSNKTSCKTPSGTIPGTTRFIYSRITQLPPSATWRILFDGRMDNSGKTQSGYTNLISNITNNSGFGYFMYLQATLNNLHAPNSSPEYSVAPTPFYCVNTPHQYNQGVIDKDNDILRFNLIPPLDLNAIATHYVSPYSFTYPFATQSGSLFYDSITGQMSFTPAKIEVSLIVNEVREYRNGELVGSSMRAMTFFIRNDCNNQAPSGDIDPSSVVGGELYNNTLNLCDGQQTVSFQIPVTDNNADNINVVLTNLPQGANVTVKGNGSKNPVIEFSWDMSNTAAGTYTFFANYNDEACPIPGNQVMAYTINLVTPFTVFHEVLEPTDCIRKQKIRFHTDGGVFPRQLKIYDESGKVITTHTDWSGSLDDSFKTGTYKAELFAEHLPCITTYHFDVSDFGTYPLPPEFEDIDLCLGAQPVETNAKPAKTGVVQWYDMNMDQLPGAPVYNTDSVRQYQWLVNQKVRSCESVFDTFNVAIHDYPDIHVKNTGGHACVGDGMYLEATGGIRYEWLPKDKIVFYDSMPYAFVYGPVTFIVKGYSEFNCMATDTVSYDNIEQCCLFSYPTAFTPDGNGTNDGWHPITYGNVDFYLLSVYDRWGERVYTSSDPKEKWDGTYLGRSCAIGTYYYYLRATCITGHEEKKAGSFILIR